MSWRTIYITESERLGVYLDSLLVIKNGDEYKIPLSDIGSIIIEDTRTTVTIKLMNKILEYGILLVVCDDKHNPSGIFNSMVGHIRQGKIVRQQLEWKQIEKDNLWKEIIKIKLDNQKEVLKKLNKDRGVIEKIQEYMEEVIIGDASNREGLGAKVYFRELFGEEFIRGGYDVINSALDYGYTIFNSKIARVIVSKGLLPYIGIHHKSEYNHFNLASDIIEVYRPIIDYYIALYMKNATYFAREDRIELVNLLNTKILQNNCMEVVGNSMEKYVDMILKYFETGELDMLKFPSLKKIKFYEL